MERACRSIWDFSSKRAVLFFAFLEAIKFVFLSNSILSPFGAITVYVLVLSIRFPLFIVFSLFTTATTATAKIAKVINIIFFISHPIYRPSSITMVVARRPTRRGGIVRSLNFPFLESFSLHPTYIPFMLLLPIISRASTRSLERLR